MSDNQNIANSAIKYWHDVIRESVGEDIERGVPLEELLAFYENETNEFFYSLPDHARVYLEIVIYLRMKIIMIRHCER